MPTTNLILEESFICPISREVMMDPVILVGDGHTYERGQIARALKHSNKSPVTGEELASTELVPNYVLRSMIFTCYPHIENQYRASLPTDAAKATTYSQLIRQVSKAQDTLQEYDIKPAAYYLLHSLAFKPPHSACLALALPQAKELAHLLPMEA